MRKSLLLLAAIVPLAGAAFTLPVLAQTAATPDVAGTGAPALDLEAIPVKPVVGPLAVQGVAGDDDEDGDGSSIGDARDHDKHGAAEAKRESGSHDDDGDED